MKQNSQWLSQVRTWSKSALATSAPSGSPAGFSTVTVSSRPPRRRSISTSGSSARPAPPEDVPRHLAVEPQHLVAGLDRPARSAGDAGATATTRGRLIAQPGYRSALGSLEDVDVDRVLLASPRGFCAGVEMAIKALAWMVRTFEPPVYCYHEIVHNKLVVDRFKALGVVFVDDIAEVPDGAPIMLSAHGSAP